MPFYMNKSSKDERCSYVPSQKWGVAVISIFNTIPFVFLVINYFIIWKIAFKKGYRDRKLRDSISSIPTSVTHRNGNAMLHVQTQKKIRSVDDYDTPRERHEMVGFIDNKQNDLTKTASKTSALMFALELKATRLALAFMLTYLLCWSPMAIFYFIDNITQHHLTKSSDRTSVIARFAVKIISFSSSIFVPLVYIWRSKVFKNEIQRKCSPKKFRKKRQLSVTKYIPRTFLLKKKLLE